MNPQTFNDLAVIFTFAQTIQVKFYFSKDSDKSMESGKFSNTKKPAKPSTTKSYQTSDQIFTKSDDLKVRSKAKLGNRGCFICGADNQLIDDGHQCNSNYKNQDGKGSPQGQLYFEKAKLLSDVNAVSTIIDESEAKIDEVFDRLVGNKCNLSTVRTHIEGKLVK